MTAHYLDPRMRPETRQVRHARGRRPALRTRWHRPQMTRLPLFGMKIADVRAPYCGDRADKPNGFDWSRLHEILSALPAGTWTSYSDLADAVGTAPQPLGAHVTRCQQCSYPWRVLTSEGRVAEKFAWSDPDDDRIPADLLAEEGVHLVDNVADKSQRLDSDALSALIQDGD